MGALHSMLDGVDGDVHVVASGDPLIVTGEVLVPITFVACARPGTALGAARAIGTHSHAWAQVRGWAQQHAVLAIPQQV